MPRNWVDRDDRQAGSCPAGPVSDEEQVAKLLNSEAWDAQRNKIRKAAFQTHVMFPPNDRLPNNTIGNRDGESLLRCSSLTLEDLLKRAHQQVPVNCHGAARAEVAAIRAIAVPHDPNIRLFRVYEDPTDQDPEHCVIRFDTGWEAVWGWARGELMRVFERGKIGP